MSEIVAANNLTIQHDSERWSLFNGTGDTGYALITAKGEGVSYPPPFATARRLPQAGYIPVDQLMMVVVGWAAEDSSWHLGLLLAPEVAEARGGRWCGLARWEDQDGDLAEQAGQALAHILKKPFRFVPSADQPMPVRAMLPISAPDMLQEERPQPSPVPLMPLPIDMDEWVVNEDAVGLRFEHSKDWNRALVFRAMIFGLLTPIFGVLSVGALLTPYATVQPEQLPLIGLGITLVMLFNVYLQIRALVRGPITLIDRRSRLLRQTMRSGRRTLVQSPFEGLQYILVSHVINRRRARTMTSEGMMAGPVVYSFWAEVWLHAFSPRRGFIEICHVTDIEGRVLGDIDFSGRRALDLHEINTPVHHAAILAANEIDIPIYVEER